MVFLACYSFLLSGFASCTVKIDMGGELNRTIFPLVGRMHLIHLSIKDVPRMIGTTKFLNIPNVTHTLLSPIRICNTIFPTTSSFWSVAHFSFQPSQGRIDSSQFGSTRSLRSRIGPALVLNTQLIRRIRDAVKPNLMATFYFFLWTSWLCWYF